MPIKTRITLPFRSMATSPVITLGSSASNCTAGSIVPHELSVNGLVNLATNNVLGWGTDTGMSRNAAAVVDVGNGTHGDASGTIKAANLVGSLYKGQAGAPTGAFGMVGWAFTQGGHASFCNGTS